MIRNRSSRRIVGVALVVIGAFLMWAAASPILGVAVFVAAIIIEAAGIYLEHQAEAPEKDSARSARK